MKTTKIITKNGHIERMLIVGSSGSGKTNTLLNLIQQVNDNLIDKI